MGWGVAMVAEPLLRLRVGRTRSGLAANDDALHIFSFLMLLYRAIVSVVSVRERPRFWAELRGQEFHVWAGNRCQHRNGADVRWGRGVLAPAAAAVARDRRTCTRRVPGPDHALKVVMIRLDVPGAVPPMPAIARAAKGLT